MFFPKFMKSFEAIDLMTRRTKLERLDKPTENFLFARINEWMKSDSRNMMLTAQAYYRNENDIINRKRYYVDRRGIQQEITNLSNSRLAHPFLRKLTNQKVNYLLSKDLSLQTENNTFYELLLDYLDRPFLKLLKIIGREAIVNGIAWLQAYYDEEGNLKFKRIPSEEILPFWKDADHIDLEAVLRVYKTLKLIPNGELREVQKLEYHTLEGVWFYEMGDDGLIPDPDHEEMPKGHFTVIKENQKIDGTWERLPFIPFRYNSNEISLLQWIKPLIDDYDINTSDTSNNLQDIPNSIKVVKNYDGTDKTEFTQNLAVFRTVFVSSDGDMKTLETKLDIGAIDSHLERLRKDIYEAGHGVDTQELKVGNASSIAIKFRFADLDSDTEDFASEMLTALHELLRFIRLDALHKGKGDFMKDEVDIIFNTDIIINESDTIAGAKNSVGVISQETIIANHPWVIDPIAETAKLKAEREEYMTEILGQYDPVFGDQTAVKDGENMDSNLKRNLNNDVEHNNETNKELRDNKRAKPPVTRHK